MFCKPAALRALSSLHQLSVSLIPMPSLAALAHLPVLDSLVLRQAQPVSSGQCLALARCKHLRGLTVSSLAWPDVAHLAPLTGLTELSLQVCMFGGSQQPPTHILITTVPKVPSSTACSGVLTCVCVGML